jgi:hypothetical protein
MLKRCAGLGAMVALSTTLDAAAAPKARAAAAPAVAPRAIFEPVRLTAGASSELMGTLASDERALYFVSDASGTLDVMRQSPPQSGPRPFSSGLGDAAWPEVSPDGEHIAYVSYERDSTGDACVRAIAASKDGGERCLTGEATAELQVLWWGNDALAALSRRALHGDFSLWRLPLDGKAPSELVARNMVGVALSPDRRWLAYIPLARADASVGITFAQRTGNGVGLTRLDGERQPGAERVYVPPLPGVTGSVTFSRDGAFLYFTQFLNDTNGDGRIDGDDNAVIFRLPFRGQATDPLAVEREPEQLTSARWDCHYPAPAASRLVASCSHEGSLDIYSLPLEGSVPRQWDDARLAAEGRAARDLWTRLLLSSRRLALAASAAQREPILLEMLGHHLELGEYASVIYYAEERLQTPEARRYGRVVAELARHRREDLALIRGETSEPYIQSERARTGALRAELAGAPPPVAALCRLVISEIEDDIGDKAAALQTFRSVDLTRLDDPLVVAIAAQRAERLYRLRGAREPLLDVYRAFAGLPGLSVAERLKYAQRFVGELGRGRARAAREAALARAVERTERESELGLLLAVEAALLPLDDANQEAVRARIFELYQDDKDVDRRRALVLSTLRAAARAGNEYLQYQFVNTWASSLRRADPERKYAEELYDSVVLDRAYGEGRQGKTGEARGYFYGATVATDSLEAHIGFIEARLAEGGADVDAKLDEVYAKRFQREPESPQYAFARAYRIARALPQQRDLERHERDVEQVVQLLTRVAAALPKERQLHQLWGFALHQRARRTGSREAAVDANQQYLLALDLARDDERLSAALLHRLGLLQASLGNHGLALRYLERRDELPHVRPIAELGLRVARARSAWHAGDAGLARAQMSAASRLLEAQPSSARFRPLVLDRLALSLALAGDHAAARAGYAELADLLERTPGAAPVNRLKAALGLASNALSSGEASAALRALEQADQVLDASKDLTAVADPDRRSLIGEYGYTSLQYRALIAGLRAGAAQALGDHAAALAAIERRVALLGERLAASDADEDRLELAQTYHHLARLQHRRGDARAAVRAVERGLTLSDRYNASTSSEVNEAQLALVRDYAELYLYGGAPRDELARDPRAELSRVYAVICKYRNPRWAEQRYRFSAYLTELALTDPRPKTEGVAHDDPTHRSHVPAGPPARAELR